VVPDVPLADSRHWIDECYSADTAEQIVAELAAAAEPDARKAAKQIRHKSPTCVKVALAAVRRARDMTSLEQATSPRSRTTSWASRAGGGSTMSRVAFVGRCNMGAPMAANLVKAGHEVTGYDLVERRRRRR
jgi:hypothetical protein